MGRRSVSGRHRRGRASSTSRTSRQIPASCGRIEICYPRLPSGMWKERREARVASVELRRDGCPPCSARGAAASRRCSRMSTSTPSCIAEHLWGMALMLTRNLHLSLRAQMSGTWETARVSEGRGNPVRRNAVHRGAGSHWRALRSAGAGVRDARDRDQPGPRVPVPARRSGGAGQAPRGLCPVAAHHAHPPRYRGDRRASWAGRSLTQCAAPCS